MAWHAQPDDCVDCHDEKADGWLQAGSVLMILQCSGYSIDANAIEADGQCKKLAPEAVLFGLRATSSDLAYEFIHSFN